MRSFVLSSLVAAAYGAHTFGPNHCVSVYRSAAEKTCVLKTNCDGLSLDKVEFAFTCQLPNMLQKHSFGVGGFDAVEEFDTGVKCDACGLPSEVNRSLKDMLAGKKAIHDTVKQQKTVAEKKPVVALHAEEPAAAEEEKKEEASTSEKKEEEPVFVSYGPSNCVETWLVRDPAVKKDEVSLAATDGELGQCVVQTKCKDVSHKVFNQYPVGLICVSKEGTPVRHIFGAKSFDQEETFDTLIRCSQCLGLDEVSESVSLEGDVVALSKAVSEIKDAVKELKDAVQAKEAPKLLLKKKEAAPEQAKLVVEKKTSSAETNSQESTEESSDDSSEDDEDDA
jgi:hypothetical protein